MGQVLHGCATTTEAVRRAIQGSQESLRALSRRYGVNQKTILKWKQRGFTADLPTGPRQVRSTVLSAEQEAIIVAFRRHTLLSLDDCLYALQPTIGQRTPREACKTMVELLSMAHERACEAQLADVLTQGLSERQLPDLKALCMRPANPH